MRKLCLPAIIILLSVVHGYSQSFQWANTFGSSSTGEYCSSVTTDANGNRYVTGGFALTVDFDPGPDSTKLTSAGGFDIFVAKYNSAGSFIWALRIGGSSTDGTNNIVYDGNGNLYLCGAFKGSNVDFDPGSGTNNLSSAGGYDIFVAKFDTAGNHKWAFRAGGSTNDDLAFSMALGPTGKIAICGQFEGNNIDFDPGSSTNQLSSSGLDAYLAIYDTSGNYVWAMNPSGGTLVDLASLVRFDVSGNVYLTGYFASSSIDFNPGAGTAILGTSNYNDIFLAKYNSIGVYQWAFQIGTTNTDELGYGMTIDGNSKITICGIFDGASAVDFDPGSGTASMQATGNTHGSYDMFIAQFDTFGSYQWAVAAGGSGNEVAGFLSNDVSNNLYLIGRFDGSNVDFDPGSGTAYLNSNGSSDVFIAKYSSSSAYQWAFAIGGNSADFSRSVICDGSKILATGSFQGSNVDFDPGSGTANRSSNGGWDIFFAQYGIGLAPVSWLYAQAEPVDERVRLRWATASELNNHYFTVERSADLQQWDELNRQPGNGTTSIVHTYMDWDETPLAGTSYYRIKQTDYNGSFDHSSVMVVNRNTEGFAIYPNPTQGSITLETLETNGLLHIYNSQGDLQRSVRITQNKQQLNLNELPNGMYLLQYVNNNSSLQQKLVLER